MSTTALLTADVNTPLFLGHDLIFWAVIATIWSIVIMTATWVNFKMVEPEKRNDTVSITLIIAMCITLLGLIAGWIGLVIMGPTLFSKDQGQVTGQMISQYPAPVS